jgi:hypothetical protein
LSIPDDYGFGAGSSQRSSSYRPNSLNFNQLNLTERPKNIESLQKVHIKVTEFRNIQRMIDLLKGHGAKLMDFSVEYKKLVNVVGFFRKILGFYVDKDRKFRNCSFMKFYLPAIFYIKIKV